MPAKKNWKTDGFSVGLDSIPDRKLAPWSFAGLRNYVRLRCIPIPFLIGRTIYGVPFGIGVWPSGFTER